MRGLDDQRRRVRLHAMGLRLLEGAVGRLVRRGFRHPLRGAGWIARRVLRRGLIGPGLVILGAGGMIVMIALLFAYEGITGLWVMIFSPVAVSMTAAAGLVALGVRAAYGHVKDAMVIAMLHRHRCPACAYDMAGIVTGGEEFIRCPECGAAWLADRLGRGERPSPRVIVVKP
jgi:hypothetical protein